MKDGLQAGTPDLYERTKKFAVRIVRLYAALPKTAEAQVMGRQVLRSGTSAGAQYREARRAKSDADLVNKIEGALQELDETAYWLELLEDTGVVPAERLKPLRDEADVIMAIFVSIVKKIKQR
jgi:four helix bundle protein